MVDIADGADNQLGYNAGGGVMAFVSDRVGLRADLRYVRNLQRSDDSAFGFEAGEFNYSRGSVGVLFRF